MISVATPVQKPLTAVQALAACQIKFGTEATVQRKTWVQNRETGLRVTLYYCWLNGVIRAVGGSWADLLTDHEGPYSGNTNEKTREVVSSHGHGELT